MSVASYSNSEPFEGLPYCLQRQKLAIPIAIGSFNVYIDIPNRLGLFIFILAIFIYHSTIISNLNAASRINNDNDSQCDDHHPIFRCTHI